MRLNRNGAKKRCVLIATLAAVLAGCVELPQDRRGGGGGNKVETLYPDSIYGIDMEGVPEEHMDELLNLVQESGATWIRIMVLWANVEPNPPKSEFARNEWGYRTGEHEYDWRHLDAVVDAAALRKLNVYFTIMLPPKWSNGASKGCNPFIGPDLTCGNIPKNPDWYSDFMYNLADHFRGRVQFYGPLNEPNDGHFFNGPHDGTYLNVYMDTYAKRAREAVKAADPDARLVGPELSMGTGVPSGDASWDRSWLEPILRYFPDVFDVISIHNHSDSHANARKKADRARELIERYAPGKELWVTEFGADVCNISEERQAEEIEGVYIDTMNRPRWTKTFFYTFVDNEGEPCWSGLYTAFSNGFRQRPAYVAYQTLAGGSRK